MAKQVVSRKKASKGDLQKKIKLMHRTGEKAY